MSLDTILAVVLRRERAVTAGGLIAVVALAWVHLLRLRGAMPAMSDMGMAAEPWGAHDLLLAMAMWTAMMIAMMLPSAAPMILTFVTLNRRRRETGGPSYAHTAIFALGYLAVWSAFSVVAAGGEAGLRAAAIVSDLTTGATWLAGGLLLIAAGIYQLTPLKYACLSRCRTPLGFLVSEWRPGRAGALVMGLRHGLFCVGCCWTLMTLLFVGGVMNLAWVAVIAGFVLVEKLLPGGRVVSWTAGAALIAWGAAILARGG